MTFQYPEGFWPDGDVAVRLGIVGDFWSTRGFQYPEGFWPDGDNALRETANKVEQDVSFSTPKGFGPMVTVKLKEAKAAAQAHVSVPRRVLARW